MKMKVNITDYFSKKNKGKSKKQTANEFTNIKDIRDYFLYTNDGYIMSYIQVFDFNVNLFNETEKEKIAIHLAKSLSSYPYPFKFFSLSRAVDIKPLITEYQQMLTQTKDYNRRSLLRNEINTLANFSTVGEITERLFYFVLFRKLSETSQKEFLASVYEMQRALTENNIKTNILSEKEIYTLVNLFFFI